MSDTIFLLTGRPNAGKTTAAALIVKLLRPTAKYASLSHGVSSVVDKVYSAHGPTIVDNWTTYEEAIALKGCDVRLITIEIARRGTDPTELPMGRTSHIIENNSSISDLERQLAAMLRQYYPDAGSR